jgi:hypothetical protein
MREELTRERLLELLDFDETLSRFRWRERPGNNGFNAQRAGKLAGYEWHIDSLTYRRIGLEGKNYYEHRLVWLFHYGHFPTEKLDHKDGDGLNNAKENLQLAPGNLNHKNMAKYSANTSGYNNVYWCKQGEEWHVRIQHNGIGHYGGHFKKEGLHLAIAKAKEMREAFGFSPAHGLTREERKNHSDQPILTGDVCERKSLLP